MWHTELKISTVTFQKELADPCSVLFRNTVFSTCCHNPTHILSVLIQLLVHVPFDLGSGGSIPCAMAIHSLAPMKRP